MDFYKETFGNSGVLEFNSEDDYNFTECTFIDQQIKARVPYIQVEDCNIIRDITIDNEGIGDLDTVRLYDVKQFENNGSKISIKSSSVAVHSCKIMGEGPVILTGDSVEIKDSDLNGKVVVEFLTNLIIEDSNIKSLQIIGPRDKVLIKNSTINGVEIKDAEDTSFDILTK